MTHPRTGPRAVQCCICGREDHTQSRGICYRSADGKWECADEIACLARRRANVAEEERMAAEYADRLRHGQAIDDMQRALDKVWAQLEREGWMWPPTLNG